MGTRREYGDRAGAANPVLRRLHGSGIAAQSLTREEVADVGLNSRRVGRPLRLPMTVDLPAGAGQAMVVVAAPLTHRIVRGAEGAIGSEMSGQCDGSRGCGGAHDLAALGKRSMQLHSYFEPNAAIPINRDVAPAPCLLRPYRRPRPTRSTPGPRARARRPSPGAGSRRAGCSRAVRVARSMRS